MAKALPGVVSDADSDVILRIRHPHQLMVTLDEFERAQTILGRPLPARPKTRTFAFTGMIRCRHCGCSITAEGFSKSKEFDG